VAFTVSAHTAQQKEVAFGVAEQGATT